MLFFVIFAATAYFGDKVRWIGDTIITEYGDYDEICYGSGIVKDDLYHKTNTIKTYIHSYYMDRNGSFDYDYKNLMRLIERKPDWFKEIKNIRKEEIAKRELKKESKKLKEEKPDRVMNELDRIVYYASFSKRLGCVFESDTTYLSVTQHYEYNNNRDVNCHKMASMFNATYGHEVSAIKFKKIKDLETMIQYIQPMYENMTQENIVGDIPEFIQFYGERKRFNGTFEESYKWYYPNSNNVRNFPAYLLALRLLIEIRFKIPEVEHCNAYLVAVHEKSSSNLLEEFDLSHVAGAIRIEVNNRPGVILMDMGHNAFGPVVIMKDQKHPHMFHSYGTPIAQSSQETSNGRSNIFKATFKKLFCCELPAKEEDALGTIEYAGNTYNFIVNNEQVIVQKNGEINNLRTYDIRLPYCSFVTTTFKRQLLLNTTKYLMVRDKKGFPIASISFDVTKENPQFTMTIYEKNRIKKQMNIGFNEFLSMNETQHKHYSAVYYTFKNNGYDDYLVKNLNYALRIGKDLDFIEEYKEYHNYMVEVSENRKTNSKHF